VKHYKHIFFDLDHTLWDFQTNSRLTLHEIFSEFKLQEIGGFSEEKFITLYEHNNQHMWMDYRNGKMSKETLRVERFRQTLYSLGLKNKDLSYQISDYYVVHSPVKTALFPGSIDVLAYLKEKYELHIITNGFEEVQSVKLNRSGLSPFFIEVITSEQAGSQKPHPAIFSYSLKRTGAKVNESLMIGDNQLVDVQGAQKIGMDAVFFNPEKEDKVVSPTYEIFRLDELRDFL
jgi:putative hydrolase of the HAD superfamily